MGWSRVSSDFYGSLCITPHSGDDDSVPVPRPLMPRANGPTVSTEWTPCRCPEDDGEGPFPAGLLGGMSMRESLTLEPTEMAVTAPTRVGLGLRRRPLSAGQTFQAAQTPLPHTAAHRSHGQHSRAQDGERPVQPAQPPHGTARAPDSGGRDTGGTLEGVLVREEGKAQHGERGGKN